MPKNFEPTTSFTLEGLKPNTEYVFRLAARSALGLGAFTPEVRERTLQSSRCLSFSHPSLRGRQSGSQRWWAQGYGAVGRTLAVLWHFTHLGFLCREAGSGGDGTPLGPAAFSLCCPRWLRREVGLVHALGGDGRPVSTVHLVGWGAVKSSLMGRAGPWC